MACECVKSELDLFSRPLIQTSIEDGKWIEHHPIASITDDGPLEFFVSGSGEDYVDLANTYLYIQAKIIKSDGTDLAGGDIAVPVNNWLHSLFSQVDVSLNETLITPSSQTYAFRAYIENLISYSEDAKKTQLGSVLWFKDTKTKMDSLVLTENIGLNNRNEYTKTSKTVDMMGRLHVDLFHQDRYLLNKVDMKLRLIRSRDVFSLMTNVTATLTAPKVKIVQAALYVRKAKLNSSVSLAHAKVLEKNTVKYPVRRVDCKVFTVSQGSRSVNQENVFLGQLPKRVVIGMVDNDAFNGAFDKNPFHFKHNDLNFLALYVDGQQVPSKPLKPDFTNGLFVRSYVNLFSATGKMNEDEGNAITREDFANGYSLFAFDLTPDLSEGHNSLIKRGNLRIEMQFAKSLPTTTNIIVYAEFDNLIEIDRSRNVLFDYSA
jgi:hypothetical protein